MKLSSKYIKIIENTIGMIQYVELHLKYDYLKEDIIFKIYPHEFNDLDELYKLFKSKIEVEAPKLYIQKYNEQILKENQLNFF